MVLSDCSSSANSNHVVISKRQSTLVAKEEEKATLCRLLSRSREPRRGPRQYTRKDENPPPMSPTRSIVLDADDGDSSSSFDTLPDSQHQRADDSDDEDGWESDEPLLQKRIYDSPRLITEDDEIFPRLETYSLYQEHEQRWRAISEAAGSHRQDGSSLVLQRNMNPVTLRCGIISQFVGLRVKRMSLSLDDNEDILPQWLDVIVDLFPNLQELDLRQDSSVPMIDGGISLSAQMRRLYILYRLPQLKCINGQEVRPDERELARPSTPGGARVQQTDWMNKNSVATTGTKDEDDVSELDSLGIPANTSIGSKTAAELGAELAQLTEQFARLHDDDDGGISLSESMFDDEDSLFGEDFLGQTCSEVSSFVYEERQDLVAPSRDKTHGKPRVNEPMPLGQQKPAAMDEQNRPPPPPPRGPPAQQKSLTQSNTPAPKAERNTSATKRATSRSEKAAPIRGHSGLDESYELVSVASSYHEWTAACGVLSFRTDRGCAPRLRLNFLGKNRKGVQDKKNAENGHSLPRSSIAGLSKSPKDSLAPMERLRLQKARAAKDHVTNQRQSRTREFPASSSSGLPSSTNQTVPPSQSLTSPFPMQFRDRKTKLYVATNGTALSTNKAEAYTVSAPRARGSAPLDTITKPVTLTVVGGTVPVRKTVISETKTQTVGGTTEVRSSKKGFPPPCPGPVRRKVGAASLLQRERDAARRQRRLDRQIKLLHENARSSSMLDGLDDDSIDSDEEYNEEENDHVFLDAHTAPLHEGNEW